MSYVDVLYDRKRDRMKIAERVNGQLITREAPVDHVFYYEHPAGTHQSIYGHQCKKFVTSSSKKMQRKLLELAGSKNPPQIFESDIRPEFRFLVQHFKNAEPPILNVGFFDIEADFHPTRGYAPTDDPFNAVTAITVHCSDTLFTLALCPPTLGLDEARTMCEPIYRDGELDTGFENTIVFDDEVEMLRTFLDLIEDVDLLSGWHSEGYDIPYLINRIKRLLGDNAVTRMCQWGNYPREREYTKFGKIFKTYDLVGRVHLDYLLLYQKHNPQQQLSYKLDYIGEIEVGENKTVYEGNLDDLYKKDFYRFVAYNRQDVMILVKIDQKKKFIELANQIAHANCVLLKTTMGTVALVEQAIINEMHDMGFVVPNRKAEIVEEEIEEELDDDDDAYTAPKLSQDGRTPVVGAYVAKPNQGLHEEIACVDINSLYPSAIRALNMSPETIVGQVRPTQTMKLVKDRIANKVPRAEAWDGIFALLEVGYMQEKTDDMVVVDFEDGTFMEMSGADLHDFIFDPQNHLCISANGTIFRTDKEGIIPKLLAKWYAERKNFQRLQAEFHEMTVGVTISEELERLLND